MNKKIRVFRIQHNFVEPTNHRLLDELAKFPELEVHSLCPYWGIESGNLRRISPSFRADLSVGHTVLTKHYATTFFVDRFGAEIRRIKPDIISVHEEPYSLAMGQALIASRMFAPKAKLIFCSAQNIFKKFPPPFAQIERMSFRTTVAGYGCCKGVMDVVRQKGYKGIFEVFPLGIDPELFTYRQRDGDIGGRPFVVGYMGQVVEEKGIYTLMKAFAALKGNVKMTILGGGPDLEKLKQIAQAAGVAERVETPGPVPHAKVPETLDRFDVLVVPSETIPTWKEQFGRVITEAFSMGVPVIGSDSGSIPEVVGDAGLVFREKDHEQLRSLIQGLIDKPARLPVMSEKGRARVMENYTWKRLAEMNRDLFMRVMEGKI